MSGVMMMYKIAISPKFLQAVKNFFSPGQDKTLNATKWFKPLNPKLHNRVVELLRKAVIPYAPEENLLSAVARKPYTPAKIRVIREP